MSAWMAAYGKKMQELILNLEYFALQGSSDGKLDLRFNAEMMKSAFAEVKRLEIENTKLLEQVNLKENV